MFSVLVYCHRIGSGGQIKQAKKSSRHLILTECQLFFTKFRTWGKTL